MTRRQEIALVAAITIAGAILRVFQLGTQSLWLDELFSVAAARGDWTIVVSATAAGDTNPPLYNLLLHAAMQLGDSEVMVRLPSCILSILSIPLMYMLALDLFGKRTAWLAALAIAVNPFHVLFAQEARMYALLGFLTLSAALFFHRAWFNGGYWNWGLFILAGTLELYTHSLAFLYLVALDVFALAERKHWRERWRPLVAAHFVLFILFIPWVGVQLQQALRVQAGFWGSIPSPVVFLTVPYLLLNSGTMPPVLVGVTLFANLALLVLSLVAATRRIRSGQDDVAGLYLALALLFVPLVGLYTISLFRPIFVERTLLPSSFGLVLLLAWALAYRRPRALNLGLGAAVFIGMTAALANYYFNPVVQKPPFREAANAVAAQLRPGDVVVHTSDSSALAFDYYVPELQSFFLAGDPDYVAETTRGRTGRVAGLTPTEWDSVASQHTRVWLVVALDHNVEYQRARVYEADAAFDRVKTQNVGGIAIYLYEVSH